MSERRALITGITGQDGSYLAELLLEKGYEVAGMVRRSSTENFDRIAHLTDRITLVQADLLDQSSLVEALEEARPNEVYNLGAQSFVPTSWKQPVLTAEFTAVGVTRCLEAVRRVTRTSASTRPRRRRCSGRCARSCRTSDAVLPALAVRRGEGVRALHHGQLPRVVRALCRLGILFNHESSRRGLEFVTRKISTGSRASSSPRRRTPAWEPRRRAGLGLRGDCVEAMWLMVQQNAPEDFVVATGEPHSVLTFAEVALEHAGLSMDDHVVVDPEFLRPAEVDHLVGDAAKAREKLGWEPRVSFRELVELMVDADVERLTVAPNRSELA
jgi:GDPmannose 4,6-dehydratase